MAKTNDFVILIATVNGSGSQSANTILVRSLFRMGVPVGGKNLFPSNIQGLPTWFTIRANPFGFVGRRELNDIVIALNPQTLVKDIESLNPEGLYFYDAETKFTPARKDVHLLPIPFRNLVADLSGSIKIRKLLTNMIYVGVLAEVLELDPQTLSSAIEDQFSDKREVLEANRRAVLRGREFAASELGHLKGKFKAQGLGPTPKEKILIDGNSAAALGALCGGCTMVSWYPITPASSLVESLQSFSRKIRIGEDGRQQVAIIQSEDELAAVCAVVGAGWAGARAMTATSGPGLSLMAEAAGLSYFAEIPAVIWDVQRAGPSTGLPTRTMQGDVAFAAKLSHGDTRHVLLFPSSVQECFTMAQLAFDLADRLQTLVIVLSDLDLGMNLHMSDVFQCPTQKFDRGKILASKELDQAQAFNRYKDVDGDGITWRTLPGTEHPKAGYFTRGTGHDEKGNYTEDPQVFKNLLARLAKKWETAKALVPTPIEKLAPAHLNGQNIGVIAYGSTDLIMAEAESLLLLEQIRVSYLRIRSYPFTDGARDFISRFERVFVVEQNRDGQMLGLLCEAFPDLASRMVSVVQYDGLPLTAEHVAQNIVEQLRGAP